MVEYVLGLGTNVFDEQSVTTIVISELSSVFPGPLNVVLTLNFSVLVVDIELEKTSIQGWIQLPVLKYSRPEAEAPSSNSSMIWFETAVHSGFGDVGLLIVKTCTSPV